AGPCSPAAPVPCARESCVAPPSRVLLTILCSIQSASVRPGSRNATARSSTPSGLSSSTPPPHTAIDHALRLSDRHVRQRAPQDPERAEHVKGPRPGCPPASATRSRPNAARAYGPPVHERGQVVHHHARDRRGSAAAPRSGDSPRLHPPLRRGLRKAACR